MDRNTVPHPAQLALAMAIVKQKPVDLTIRDHVLQIRHFIKNSKTAESSYAQDQDKFFDSVLFWQQAYERSEAEQSKLLDRIYDLERRNEALVAKVQGSNTTFDEDQLLSKRKKVAANKKAAGGVTARKRAKTHIGPFTDNVSSQDVALRGELSPLGPPEEATGPFMRQIYTLQKALRKRTCHLGITRAAIILCKTAADEVLTAVSNQKAASGSSKKRGSSQTEKPRTAEVLRSIGCASQSLLETLKVLPKSERDEQNADHVIYHIVRLYESMMNALEQWCRTQAGQIPTAQSAKQKKATRSRNSKDGGRRPDNSVDSEDEVSNQIVRQLNTMTLSLDSACSGHQDLLEGFLFILLSRVGRLLCLFVFQDLKLRSDFRTDPRKLPLPTGLTEVDLNERTLHAAEMEGKCLVWLLQRTLVVLHTFTSSISCPASRDSGGSVLFAAKLKEKLQSTLLQAVFGRDTIWGQTLQRPDQPDEDSDNLYTSSDNLDQSVPDWYIQEIWRLLGWEILANSNPSEH